MRTYWLITAILGLVLAPGGGHAQPRYPTKPIRLIVAFPPGGSTDILARMLAQKLTETFKQQVLVDNRPGGGGAIGIETAVRANPDGYTMLNQLAGTRLTHVPYKGTGAALNDLLGGQIQLVFGGMPEMIPQVKSNRLRGIAVTTAKRSNAVPYLPMVGETVPGYEAVNWSAVLGPKALPKDIVTRWNTEIDRILKLSDVNERMVAAGMEPAGGSPERFREVLERDVAKWQKVVKIADIKPGS